MKFKKILKIGLISSLVILILCLSLVLIVFTKSISEVKNVDINLSNNTTGVCKILNSEGELINKISSNQNNYVELENVSPNLIKAFISIEDKKFYKHNGLNYLRIAKALINNLKAGEIKEGASTISQQLIKNKYLTNEKSIDRKIKEMYLTLKLESQENKDTILESYINSIYYGNGSYGISDATHRFFNKNPDELSLSECAVIAGIVKSPATYSPINNIENCKNRRNLVLKEMYEDNVISLEEYEIAKAEDIELNITPIHKYDNLDLYSKKAINEASKILNISKYEILNNGYTLYTYQDLNQQTFLDSIINDDSFYQRNEYGNIADSLSVIMDNNNASITAVSGRSNYDLTSFKRQPGSLIKPILVYTPAYEEQLIYPCSQILDEKISFGDYSPQNVSDVYYGNVTVRDAVAKSLNIPAVKLCEELGVENCKLYAEKAGINFNENDVGLSVALGGLTEGLTLEEITNAYIPYSNDGLYKKYGYVSMIKSPQNLTIYNRNVSENNYCSQESAYLMTENLIYASKNGTSKILKNTEFDIASKTGTVNVKNSNLNTDAYSLAYTTEHTISTWLGNYSMDKNYNLNGNNNGGTYATKIVKKIIDNLYENHTPKNFKIPETIISLPIDKISLNNNEIKLGYNTPEKYIEYEIFASDNIPSEVSTEYTTLPKTILEIESNNQSNTLTFNTVEYFDYYINRVENNLKSLLKKITNNAGEFTYTDSQIEFNKEYKYYVLIESPYNSSKGKSNTVKSYIEKDYSSMLDDNISYNKLSWLFT